jgi:hypothetical protein
MESFCRWKFVVKVKGFGETDVFSSGDAEARWIWPEFTRPFGFPAGGQPLCQAASDDGKTSTSPPSAWIASPSEKQNWLYLDKICSSRTKEQVPRQKKGRKE